MRRFIFILASVAIASSLACSLIYRPSDYFDPADQMTTVASGTEGATNIVLTSSLVVFSTDDGIYSVPKTGGDPQIIMAFGSNDLAAIAGDGDDLVAWCGTMGVRAWRPGGQPLTLDTSPDCTSIDAFGGRVAAAVTSDAGPTAAYQLYVFDGDSLGVDLDASSTFPSGSAQSGDRVALTTHDLYWASSSLIGRKATPGETLLHDPYCNLGLGGLNPERFQVVELSDGGPFISFLGKQGFRFADDHRCCRVSADGGENACPTDQLYIGNTYQSIVVHLPYVYYLPENELRRASISDPVDASTLVRGNLGDVRGSIAIDDDYAYVGIASDIYRIALPP
jgi:hypothetical protein